MPPRPDYGVAKYLDPAEFHPFIAEVSNGAQIQWQQTPGQIAENAAGAGIGITALASEVIGDGRTKLSHRLEFAIPRHPELPARCVRYRGPMGK